MPSISVSAAAKTAVCAPRPPLTTAAVAAYRARCRKHLTPPRELKDPTDRPSTSTSTRERHDQLHDDLP
jgi:hypothetical protein